MKLVRWLLALHLVAIAVASGVAMGAECDGDKLRALCLALMVTGWSAVLSSAVMLVRMLIKGRARAKEIVVLVLLLLISPKEGRMAAEGWEFLSALPG